MDPPRILAIDHVRLTAGPGTASELLDFYTELLGLDHLEAQSDEQVMTFCGHPRSGPKLIVSLTAAPPAHMRCRRVLIQIPSLASCASQMADRQMSFAWLHGWDFYDRRLTARDPAANRVELVARHAFSV